MKHWFPKSALAHFISFLALKKAQLLVKEFANPRRNHESDFPYDILDNMTKPGLNLNMKNTYIKADDFQQNELRVATIAALSQQMQGMLYQ